MTDRVDVGRPILHWNRYLSEADGSGVPSGHSDALVFWERHAILRMHDHSQPSCISNFFHVVILVDVDDQMQAWINVLQLRVTVVFFWPEDNHQKFE